MSYFKADFLFLKPDISKCIGTTKSQQLGPHCSMQIYHSVYREQWRAGLWPPVLVWLPGLLNLVAGSCEKKLLQLELIPNSIQSEGLYNGLIFNS